MSHHSITVEEKVNRLNRIIGQLNGVKQMVQDNRDCSEILVQIASARAALAKISLMMAEDHLDHCVSSSLRKGKGTETVSSLINAMKQMLK